MCDAQTDEQPRPLRKDYNFMNSLIEFVKRNPPLFNGQLQTEPKKSPSLWEPFAAHYNISVKECKKTWKYMRDGYVKRCKRILEKGGTLADDAHPLFFLQDIVYFNQARKKIKANTTTTSIKKCKKRKAISDATFTSTVTANMLETTLEKKRKEETLQKYNEEIFQNEADSINDVIPVVFCADKQFLAPIQDKTVTFKLSTMNVLNNPEAEYVKTNQKPMEENVVQTPVHQSLFLEKDELIDATVTTADMLLQLIEKRKKETNLLARPYNHTILNQVKPFQIHTNQEIITPIQKNTITSKVPKINVLKKTNEDTAAKKICISSNKTPQNFNVIEMDSPQVNINNLKGDLLRTGYSDLYEQNTTTTYNIRNIHKSCLEEQYIGRKGEAKQTFENKSQIVESSKESIEQYFDEMGEYVYNRFPQDKQLKLKKKIWSLIMKID